MGIGRRLGVPGLCGDQAIYSDRQLLLALMTTFHYLTSIVALLGHGGRKIIEKLLTKFENDGILGVVINYYHRNEREMLTTEQLLKADSLLRDGLSPDQVARELGFVSRSQFSYQLLRAGKQISISRWISSVPSVEVPMVSMEGNS
ncbi:hypothetical protein CCAX7_14820 [Capsulimonas corticalis]|uniref:Uncharacterized protein n=1 Tax=Capsulimonas corticalis TaxID=2219043 RepID=A0A402CZD9_9BACT|nr:hypothetical protein CCAX7_14820 [Capsulimonas corticalis]